MTAPAPGVACATCLRRTVLVTTGADWLYRKHGFTDVPKDIGFMQLHRPNIYQPTST